MNPSARDGQVTLDIEKNRPLSALIPIPSPGFLDYDFPRLYLGEFPGSKKPGQADNTPVSWKQAHNQARQEQGREKKDPDSDFGPATQDPSGRKRID
jgi:hypothetical protein